MAAVELFDHRIDPHNGVSLRDQVESILEQEIRSGRWEKGTRLPTVRDLSRMTGLSGSPISDALTALAQKGLLERRVGRGTFMPSRAPDETRRNGAIAMTCGGHDPERQFEAGESFLHALIVRASEEIQARGFSSRLLRERSTGESEPACPEEAISAQALGAVDGILNLGAVSEPVYRLAKELRLPLVCLGHAFPPADVPFVAGAEFQRMWEAVDILYRAGHRKIGLAHAFHGAHTRVTHALCESYIGALKEWGIEPRVEWAIVTDTEQKADLSRIQAYLTQSDHPTSVICMSEESAHAIYSVASLIGIRIPGDISVLGLANRRRFGTEFTPPLSLLVMPLEHFARLAVGLLMDLIEGKQPPRPEGILVQPIWKNRGSISALSGTSALDTPFEGRKEGLAPVTA